jgi:hypothetical protein
VVANIYRQFIDDKNRSNFYSNRFSDSISETYRRNARARGSDYDDHDLLYATRPHAYACSAHDVRNPQDSLFGPDRRNWSLRSHDYVRQPAFHPQAPGLIEMTDIPSAMPTRRLS